MYKVGEVFSSNSFGDFQIIEVLPNYFYSIRFLETGYETAAQGGNIKAGSVRDFHKPVVHGVGFQGSGKYYVKKDGKHSIAYKCWNDMLKRCYNKSCKDYRAYGARGVTVCDEWHNYQTFAEYYYNNCKDNFKLDKDLVVPGNKIYSESTCEFVPEHINSIVTRNVTSKHGYPLGVNKIDGKYVARMNTPTERKYLGYFPTPELAFAAYKTAKEAYIKEIATHHYNLGNISDKVYQNLLTYSVTPFPEEG